jgi:hypothetical protein
VQSQRIIMIFQNFVNDVVQLGTMSGVRGLMGRVQWDGSVGPLGLGLGIRSSPCLGVK